MRGRFLEEQQLQCAGLLCRLLTENLGFPGNNVGGSVFVIYFGNVTGFVFKLSVSEVTCIKNQISLKPNQNKTPNPKLMSTVLSGGTS